MDATVGGEQHVRLALGPRQAHIGEPPLLLQARQPVLVHVALVGKQPLLPARQEDRVELQPFGRVKRHDVDQIAARRLGILHHQRDVLKEAREVLEILHGNDQFL